MALQDELDAVCTQVHPDDTARRPDPALMPPALREAAGCVAQQAA